ncbi:MAG: hypothetical protein IPN60_16875 [Saprospiraceae bacterium]|nr:hypothetical protein [Candidatus Opimibacter skivensis]
MHQFSDHKRYFKGPSADNKDQSFPFALVHPFEHQTLANKSNNSNPFVTTDPFLYNTYLTSSSPSPDKIPHP